MAVPPFQRWLENSGNQTLLNQALGTQKEYEEVLFYKSNPETFTQYLVHVAIQPAFVGAAVGIVSGVLLVLSELTEPILEGPSFIIGPIRDVLLAGGQIIAIVSSLLIIRICRPALVLWRKVRNFDTYKQSLPKDVVARLTGTDTSNN